LGVLGTSTRLAIIAVNLVREKFVMLLRHMVCLLIACVSATLFAADETEFTTEVCGLRVVSPKASREKMDFMTPFGGNHGTSVAVLIKSEKVGIVGVDHDGSSITKYVDDKGGDLLRKSDNAFMSQGFDAFPKISADGKFCVLELNSTHLPSQGSSSVTVEGVAMLICGSTKKTVEVKDLALKAGSKVTADKIVLTISKSEKIDWNDSKWAVTFHTKQNLDDVAAIQFLKADGTEIKSSQIGKSGGGFGDNWSFDVTYGLAEATDVATIKVLLWTDLQKKKLPFKVTADVGL
jgi:hypothetical protein